jgi:hypothetical protein
MEMDFFPVLPEEHSPDDNWVLPPELFLDF